MQCAGGMSNVMMVNLYLSKAEAMCSCCTCVENSDTSSCKNKLKNWKQLQIPFRIHLKYQNQEMFQG